MEGFTYILANKPRGSLYVGSTLDLAKRIFEHKRGIQCKHTRRYNINKLVYYEIHPSILAAYHRERLLKQWYRQWKVVLIERDNPEWRDLYEDIVA